MQSKPKRAQTAQSLFELVAGLIVFIPLSYALVNIISLVFVANIAESTARNAARIAASSSSRLNARVAAERLVKESRYPALASEVKLLTFRFDQVRGEVTTRVQIKSKLPAPMAAWNETSIIGKSVVPITSFLSAQER